MTLKILESVSWIHDFDGSIPRKWMANHGSIPFICCFFYLILVFWGPLVMKKYDTNRVKKYVKPFLLGWNVTLALFSIIGSIILMPILIRETLTNGFYRSVCLVDDSSFSGINGFAIFLFIISKIPELMDTVFLVLQKKPVIFLHYYHHITVLLFCWFSYVYAISSGLWFATMNYFVHSIMYTYYACMIFPFMRFISKWAIFVTVSQILQMLIGTIIATYSFFIIKNGFYCETNHRFSEIGFMMYMSYLILFSHFFLKRYTTLFSKKSVKYVKRK